MTSIETRTIEGTEAFNCGIYEDIHHE